jgi:hypothetical protein
MMLASGMVQAFYGFGLNEMKVIAGEVLTFDGNTGSVSTMFTGPNGESLGDTDATPWRYEKNRWVRDDCESSGLSSRAEVSTAAPETTEASTSDSQVTTEPLCGRSAQRGGSGDGPTTDSIAAPASRQYTSFHRSAWICTPVGRPSITPVGRASEGRASSGAGVANWSM